MYPVLRVVKELIKYRNATSLPIDGVHVSHHICWPWDLDMWGELNNGRTLSIFDLGRFGWAQHTGLMALLRKPNSLSQRSSWPHWDGTYYSGCKSTGPYCWASWLPQVGCRLDRCRGCSSMAPGLGWGSTSKLTDLGDPFDTWAKSIVSVWPIMVR